ncbi:MAG TPA: FAD-dependent oxidoreductase [Thermomicrobiales bacterium]|nr:FAD-dependent oxidoreductase [Thermomicrobiales bacterium]
MTVSLWQDTAAWPGEIEHRVETADICVIGAGIVGSVLAKLLGEAGKSVIVLDSNQVGSGASGRNAGHCIAGLRNSYHLAVDRFGRSGARNMRAMLVENRDMVQSFCDRYAVPYERNGSQYLGIDAAEGAVLRASARALLADGSEVDYSDTDPFDRGFHGRLYQPGDLALQPYLLVTRLMADSGALVIENSEVHGIEQSGDTVAIRSRNATVACGQAILATNAWSRLLHPWFRDKIFPTRAQMYATEPSTEPRLITMPTGTEDGFEYFRQLPDGRFLIGGYRDRFVDEEVGYGDETTPHLQAGMESWVAARFPEIARLKVTHRWAGIMGFTRDALPLVGRLPDMPNVYFAAGFTGSGMSFGPATARLCAEYVLTSAHPGLFHADRLE